MMTERNAQRRDLLRIAETSLAEAIRISDHDHEPELVAALTTARDVLGEAKRCLHP